jgi:hypothetical protein
VSNQERKAFEKKWADRPWYKEEPTDKAFAFEWFMAGIEQSSAAQPAQILTCDTCNAEINGDPWHYSDGQERHKHACDTCWALVNPASRTAQPAHGIHQKLAIRYKRNLKEARNILDDIEEELQREFEPECWKEYSEGPIQVELVRALINRLNAVRDHKNTCAPQPQAQSLLEDRLDLMVDEFLRIKALQPGSEIEELCDRAISDIRQNVPVIEQRDRLLKEVHRLEREQAPGEIRSIIEAGWELYHQLRQWLATEHDPESISAMANWKDTLQSAPQPKQAQEETQ